MKCIKHVNLAAGRPRVFFVAYLQKMATRNVMTATSGQREGGDTTRQSLGDNRFLNFSPDLPISKFCTQITQASLCFGMPFVYFLPLFVVFFCCAIGVGSASWAFICYASLRGRSVFIAPTLIASVKRVAGGRQTDRFADWLTVSLSILPLLFAWYAKVRRTHCALLCLAECVKIAHQQNLHADAQFSQFPNWVFRFLGSIDWAAGQRFCTKIKTNNTATTSIGKRAIFFCFFSILSLCFFALLEVSLIYCR